MVLTNSQKKAINTFNSGNNILLLGDPGTGKSTLISEMVKKAEEKDLVVARTASTGIAAQLIGGHTIHSLLKAYPRMDTANIDYDAKTVKLKDVDVLIIDEISMIGSAFVEYLYECLRYVERPIQLIMVGDFFQLRPVKDRYAFESLYWDRLNLTPCMLTEVIRQKDKEFIENINLLKYGDARCLDYLLTHSSKEELEGEISICAKREDAESINGRMLEKLSGKPGIFAANYEGKVSFSDLQIEEYLLVKKDMRVMSIINGDGFSNGSMGKVIDFDEESVEVMFDSGVNVRFERTRFQVERKDIIGVTTELFQIPLRPAYAITIHKSQGQTFKNVNIDGTKCWAEGQLYVAVSRACSIEGIHFLTPISKTNIKT